MIQHLCGSLVQVFPSLMLQKCSSKDKDNIEALSRRLALWEETKFDEILSEAKAIQSKLQSRKKKNRKTNVNAQFIKAVENGEIRKASQSIDPNNFGLNAWNDVVKQELKAKYPQESTMHKTKKVSDSLFHDTKIKCSSIYKIIAQGKSDSGGLSHIGNHTLLKLCKLKSSGNNLILSLTKLSNTLANEKVDNLYEFMATRCIPVKKQDGSSRPVGIGDILRRIALKAIDRHHKKNTQMNCLRQLGNGTENGCEAIIHSLRKFSDSMLNSKCVILTIDASNAFNRIDRQKTLDIIYDKAPGLYLAALNTYGNDSFVLINDEKHPVVTGSVQGCPMATTFFNYGLSALIESLAKNSGIMQIWYCDDGYIYGSVESVLDAWRKIKEFGPNIGYWPNSKSTIYDLEVSNKFL